MRPLPNGFFMALKSVCLILTTYQLLDDQLGTQEKISSGQLVELKGKKTFRLGFGTKML